MKLRYVTQSQARHLMLVGWEYLYQCSDGMWLVRQWLAEERFVV